MNTKILEEKLSVIEIKETMRKSYSAQNRLKSFIREIKSHKEVWDMFEKFYDTNRKIQLNDIPTLEPLIKEIFIEKTLQ